jgi:hypothetical protein
MACLILYSSSVSIRSCVMALSSIGTPSLCASIPCTHGSLSTCNAVLKQLKEKKPVIADTLCFHIAATCNRFVYSIGTPWLCYQKASSSAQYLKQFKSNKIRPIKCRMILQLGIRPERERSSFKWLGKGVAHFHCFS